MATQTKRSRNNPDPTTAGDLFLKFRVNPATRDLCHTLAEWRGVTMSEWFRNYISDELGEYLNRSTRAAG